MIASDNACTNELLRLIKENPDLPILPMVEGDVCGSDEYAYWMGCFGNSFVDEYLIDEWYGDECVVFKSNCDIETLIEGMAEVEFGNCTNESNWSRAERELDKLWKKAIICYINSTE